MTEPTAQEAYAEAVRRIRAWQSGEALNLAIEGLTEIPECIREINPTKLILTARATGLSLPLRATEPFFTPLDLLKGKIVGAKRVSDLSPLVELTSLVHIHCSGTRVSDLSPLSELSALQSLYCSITAVSDLGPLSGHTSLQTLDCSFTAVSDLGPLSELTSLQTLHCDFSGVSDLGPLSGCTSLQTLKCSESQVSDLSPLSGLTSLRTLDCVHTQVSDLGPLSELTSLQTLDCGHTRVSDLGPLSGLTSLQTFDCGCTRVSDLGPLSELISLRTLDCGYTRVSDLGPLSGLRALQTLDCGHTRVSDLGPLSGLTALETLDFSDCLLSDLGPLSGLTALHSLNCNHTAVSDLGPLSGLRALQTLYFRETPVSDLGPLSNLPNLAELNAIYCEISEWPQEMFCREQINFLSVDRLQDVPREVLSEDWRDNCAERLRAHLLDLGSDFVALKDAKLLVLGNGRVGKTQLTRTLLGDGYDSAVEPTHGIIVRSLDLADGSKPEPRIQLWDFGGQDIYHSTHTMFMKSRGMYLLAWTPTHEENKDQVVGGYTFRNHQLPYWLNQIGGFAGEDVPLIVVQTQVDTLRDRQAIPEYAKEALAGFTNVLSIDHSAKTGRGQVDLGDALREAYQSIEKPLIGKTRFAVKRALEDLISEGSKRTMPLKEFATLCDTHGGVTRPDLFLETLHNAGVVFYRKGFFSDEIILDQQWAITAIYSVLERGTQTFSIIQSNQGKFQKALLGGLQWDQDGYSPKEQVLFIGMMEACGICFEYEQSTNHTPATYVAPDLLPETVPTSWNGADAGATQTRTYRAHPNALMRGVICAIGAKAGAKGEFWRSGLCVFEGTLQGWVRIEITSEKDAFPQITLKATGVSAADLLERVEKIVAREESRLGIRAVECDSPLTKRLPEVGDDRTEPTLSYARPNDEDSGWFFSYANADEQADESRPVATFCKKVEREQGVKIRRDVNELRVGEEIVPFMRELSQGAKIYIWLTDAYLKSPFCMFELHEIWKRSELEAAKSGETAQEAFNDRVEIVLGNAKIRQSTEIEEEYCEFWDKEFEAITKSMNRMSRIDERTMQERNAVSEFRGQTRAILSYLRSYVWKTSFDQLI